MTGDEDGDWMPLVKVVHRGESPDELWMLDRVMRGCYPMRWLDDQGARQIGKLPEHMWRAGHVNTLFGLLSFAGRNYQRIEILLPREDIEQRELESAEATMGWTDAPDTAAFAARVLPTRWRNKPSSDAVRAFVRELELEYGPDAHPAETEILETAKAHFPTVTRKQVRTALKDSPLKGQRGYRKKT